MSASDPTQLLRLPAGSQYLNRLGAVHASAQWFDWFDAYLAGAALFADVHPDHVMSQRVLSKLGFQASHSGSVHGMTMLIYRRQHQ